MNPVERVLRVVDRFQQRHTVLGLPFAVVKKFGDDEAGAHATLLTYYGFVSMFPLLLLFVTILGFALRNHPGFERRIEASVLAQLPIIGQDIALHRLHGSGVSLAVGI